MKTSVKPAIEKMYSIQKEEVLQKLKLQAVQDDGINLAGDGQYDSRGYSAMICRFSILDIKSKYVVDFEVTRKDRGGNSMELEKVGHEVCFPRVVQELKERTGLPNPIKSFTSDRCVNLAQSMKKWPNIEHFFDSWHWIRSIRKDIGEV